MTKAKLKSFSFGIFLGVAITFTLLLILDPIDVFALDWSNQDFFITDRNGNQVHWFSGTPITLFNVTVTSTEVVFAQTEFNEYRHHEFFDARRTFDVTLDFINGSRSDFTLFSGSGGSNAANVELHVNGTILDGAEINGVSALLLFTFDDVNCVINPPTGNILDCLGTNIIDIGSVAGGLDLTLFYNQTRNVPPIVLEPAVNVKAELRARSILVSWDLPLQGNPEKYIIQRSDNLLPFIDKFETDRKDDNKVINRETKRQTFWKLDDTVIGGNNYTYRIVSTQQNQQVFALPTETIFVRDQVEQTSAVAKGHLIDTGPIPPITPIISWFNWYDPFQLVSAEVFSSSIFGTLVNPQTESFRIALEPVPQPNATDNCNQVLDFEYTRNIEAGQDFQIVATIFEMEIQRDDSGPNGSIVETINPILHHQKIYTDFSDSTKLKQKWLVVPPEEQTITRYQNLELQFDITGVFDIDPNNHRSLEVWDINFVVPLGNNAC